MRYCRSAKLVSQIHLQCYSSIARVPTKIIAASDSGRHVYANLTRPSSTGVHVRSLHTVSLNSGNKWSYVHGCGMVPLLGATIGQLLEWRTNQNPDIEAVVDVQQNVRLTFKQLLDQSDRFAAGLIELGVKRGDRVGIWAPNCIEWVIVQMATARAGFILVNVNPAYQAKELEYCLKKVGVRALIMFENFKTQNYYELLSKICPEMGTSPTGKINSLTLPELKLVVITSEKKFAGTIRFNDVMASSNNEHLTFIKDQQKSLQFDDPVNIQFTSGTTGSPKGACLTHHNLINNARYVGIGQDFHINNNRVCLPVPLYHCMGSALGTLQCIIHGTSCVYPWSSFNPEATLKAIQNERCTAVYGTPTMFVDMLNITTFSQYNLKSLSTGVIAGAPCSTELMKQIINNMHLDKLTICYGTTEISPIGFQTHPNDTLERRVGTVGKIHPHVESKVIDGDGYIVPIGVPGEICFRGYGVMMGYWNDPEKTSEVIGADRWYKTGDIGVLDKDGYMQIVGRIKDMILRGGENVYPVEIEQFLVTHPNIADVHVIGVPDKRLGEQIAAWIRLKPGKTCTAEEVKAFCKGQIAHYKIPHYISFVTEYPLTITGKVQKYKMREKSLEMYDLKDVK